MSTLSVSTLKSKTALTPPVVQDLNGVESGTFCRAWVNFNGAGTVAIRASFNVSSITDNGTGDYTVNFTTAMPDGKYMVALGQPSGATGAVDGRQQGLAVVQVAGDYPSASVRISSYNQVSGAAADPLQVNVAVFR